MFARPKRSVATRVVYMMLLLSAVVALGAPATAARKARRKPPAPKEQMKPARGMHVLDLATGKQRWFRADCQPLAYTAVNHEECLVVTKDKGRSVGLLRARDGKAIWQWRKLKQPVSGSLVEGGRLYVAAKEIRCADVATGHMVWSRGMKTSLSPLGVYRGMLALSSADGVTFLEEKTGKLLDAITLPKLSEYAKVSATWAVSDALLVAGQGNVVTATDESGETWQQQLPSSEPITEESLAWNAEFLWPIVVGRGLPDEPLLVAFTGGERVCALDRATGSVLWEVPAENFVAVAGQVVLVKRTADDAARVAAIEVATGQERWQAEPLGPGSQGVHIFWGDGTETVACVPCDDNKVYALETATGRTLWEWVSTYWRPDRVLCTPSYCVVSDSDQPPTDRAEAIRLGSWRWQKVPDVPFSDCTGLAYAPTAPDTVYALADEKLFVSKDRGGTWGELPQYAGGTVTCPVVRPDNPAQLSTCDGRSLLWSNDGGTTWNTAVAPADGVSVLACSSGSPGYLYLASSSGGFWRSDLQGGDLRAMTGLGGRVERVVTACQNPNELYAVVVLGDVFGTNAKLMHSPDAGLTWAQAGKGVLQGKLVEIALAATDGGIVDVLTETGQLGPSAKALYYRSRDRGKTWSKPVAVGEFAGPISIDVRDPNRIVTFSDFVTPRLSTDGGRTWQSIANPKANITEPTAVAALGDGVVLGALGADGPHELCRLANPARER